MNYYKKYTDAFLCLTVFFVFTGYVFLNARLKDNYGDTVLLFLVFLSLPRLSAIDLGPYRKFLVCLFWAFLAMTLASVLFPPSRFANLSWLVSAQYRLVFSTVIVISLLNLSRLDRLALRWGLAVTCLLLAVLYIVQQSGVAVQESLGGITPFRLDQSKWHDKNYAFWQLLLMWGSVALLWRRNVFCICMAIVVMVLSLVAVSLSTSESSQFAAVVSLFVFAFVHLVKQEGKYVVYLLGTMLVVLLPFLWVCLAPVKPSLLSVLPEMKSIISRVELFDYTASLIKKELVIGYGFGSTLFMPIPKGEVGWQFCFPGGHTHNLVLQFFMDHGLLGLIFISALVVFLFHYLFHATVKSPQAPAVWALLFAGFTLFSLSFSIWKADIVLMYCMWLGLIFAVASRHDRNVAGFFTGSLVPRSLLVFGLIALSCYAVDYLILAKN